MAIRISNMRGRATAGLFCGASLIAAAFATPAFAQDDDAAEDYSNDDIIVTAQFREQNLQDTPIAITAVTGEAITNKAMESVVDIADTAPSVYMSRGSSAYGTGLTVYIRGIGQYDTQFAYEPGVGMYVDDVYHGVLVGSIFDLLDLDRVEILRGPQGTLAGKNSIGGAVKMFSQKPEGGGTGYLQATYGSYDRMELRGAYDVTLADNLYMRVSGFGKRREGYVKRIDFPCAFPELAGDLPTQIAGFDDCVAGTLGDVDVFGFRGALRYEPSDQLEINIIGSIIRDDSGGTPVILSKVEPEIVDGYPYDDRYLANGELVNYGNGIGANATYPFISQVDSESISGQIDWSPTDNLQLTSITAYENLDSVWGGDGDASPLDVAQGQNFSPYHQFTQELRLNADLADGLVELTVGGFYFDSLGYVGGIVGGLGFKQNDPVNNNSKSLFAHGVLHPTPELSIIGGIRYTKDKKDYTYTRKDIVTGETADAPFGFIDEASDEAESSSVDYRLGVNYRFNEQVMAYANFATGYKGGGVNPRPFTVGQLVPFDPERVDAYELGVKTDLFDRAVRLNVATFLSKYRDIILIDGNGFPGGCLPTDVPLCEEPNPDYFFLSAAPFNAGDADIKGFEVETTIEPTPGLVLEGALSYLDFKYTRLDDNATASGIDESYVPAFTAEWKASGSISYEAILPSGATVTPRFYADYRSGVYSDPENMPRNYLEGRTILNANIAFKTADRDWELIAGVTNLSDKRYFTNAFDIFNQSGRTNKVPGRPREWSVTLRKNF